MSNHQTSYEEWDKKQVIPGWAYLLIVVAILLAGAALTVYLRNLGITSP